MHHLQNSVRNSDPTFSVRLNKHRQGIKDLIGIGKL